MTDNVVRGNYMVDREGRTCIVDRTDENGFHAFALKGPVTSLPVKPIVLSRQFMEAMGFKNTMMYMWSNGLITVFYDEFRFVAILFISAEVAIEIKSVHHMQNIIAAILNQPVMKISLIKP